MIEIISVAGLATVQDGGRPGYMHEGVPPGGALAPQMLARANVSARNLPHEAGLEIFGMIAFVAVVPLTIATEHGVVHALSCGERFTLASERKTRMRYVAVRGGLDVPAILGGRGTLVVAGIGGHEGRPLRRGDVLRVGNSAPQDAAIPEMLDLDAPIRVILGPDVDRFDRHSIEGFLASTFTIQASSDRVGTRLAGPRIVAEHDLATPSAPMVSGSIQIPPSGLPIVLGPDHPTTGGYPVIATVLRRDVGSLGARPIGASVRFVDSCSKG